jgi:RNA polymerase sigma factor (sigma-70 family)
MSTVEHAPGEKPELRELIDRIRAGDEGAARELLKRYEVAVRVVVRRQLPKLLRGRFDSIDFVQSVWGDFFQRVRTAPTDFENSRQLITILAWAAKNKVIDEYRRAASQRQDIHREESLWTRNGMPIDVAGPGGSPSEIAEAREEFGRLRDILSEDRRAIVELKAAGFTGKEIAEQLKISERTVQRALEEVRRRAEGEGEG